jgi:hypothetical protein
MMNDAAISGSTHNTLELGDATTDGQAATGSKPAYQVGAVLRKGVRV